MNYTYNKKSRFSKFKIFASIFVVFILFAGLLSVFFLSKQSQDNRQQAASPVACVGFDPNQPNHYGACGPGMDHCILQTITCPVDIVLSSSSIITNASASQVSQWMSDMFYHIIRPCVARTDVTGGPSPDTYHYTVIGDHPSQFHVCSNTYCYCQNGEQSGATGPATCVHPDASSYPVPDRPGCKPTANSGGSASCEQYHGDQNGCDSVTPSLPGNPGLSANCAYYSCSNRCLPRGTSSCAAGCGGCPSGGGTGSTSTPAPINPNRTISGSVKCTNTMPGNGPFSQPYGIANVPLVAFSGTQITPSNVSKQTKTDSTGQYQLAIQQTNPNVTIRISSNNQHHEYSFLRNGSPLIDCTDTHAYEVCSYFDIAQTGVTEVNFKTNSRAENLVGQQSGTVYTFEFNKAKNALNQPIQNYIVRLDNTANGWFSNDPNAPDYYIKVPSNIGTCDANKCRVTSTQLSTITQFKGGTYAFGVNPIMPSQTSGMPIVELCRNFVTVTAPQTGSNPGTKSPATDNAKQ